MSSSLKNSTFPKVIIPLALPAKQLNSILYDLFFTGTGKSIEDVFLVTGKLIGSDHFHFDAVTESAVLIVIEVTYFNVMSLIVKVTLLIDSLNTGVIIEPVDELSLLPN